MSELNGRGAPKKLSGETKWETVLQATAGEISQADAARKWAVDVSTIIGIRRTVKNAALAALERASGRPAKELVLKSVDEAVAAGFDHTWACSLATGA